jgi:hypothetical protein
LEAIAGREHLASVTGRKLKAEIIRLRLNVDELMVGSKDETIDDVLQLPNEGLFIGGLSGVYFEVHKEAPVMRVRRPKLLTKLLTDR